MEYPLNNFKQRALKWSRSRPTVGRNEENGTIKIISGEHFSFRFNSERLLDIIPLDDFASAKVEADFNLFTLLRFLQSSRNKLMSH